MRTQHCAKRSLFAFLPPTREFAIKRAWSPRLELEQFELSRPVSRTGFVLHFGSFWKARHSRAACNSRSVHLNRSSIAVASNATS